jgi:hypothetical protein
VDQNNTVGLTLDIVYETDLAWLVTPDGMLKTWLPKSLAEQDGADPRVFHVAEWLALREGLI